MDKILSTRKLSTIVCAVTVAVILVSFLKNEHIPLQPCAIDKDADSNIEQKPSTLYGTGKDRDIETESHSELQNSEYNVKDSIGDYNSDGDKNDNDKGSDDNKDGNDKGSDDNIDYNNKGSEDNKDYSDQGSDDNKEVQFWSDDGRRMCPEFPPKRKRPITIDREALPFDELESFFPGLQKGGRYTPRKCSAPFSIGIIIPNRNRETHLQVLLHNLHRFLMHQNRDYVIFVVNQEPLTDFNKASLLNIGFTEITKRYPDVTCFIFHDVDLVPLDNRLSYSCSDQPVHLSVTIDKVNSNLTEKGPFGGVVAMTKDQFTDVNGFNNLFLGWGDEAEDIRYRLYSKGYKLKRQEKNISRYTMIKRDERNETNFDNSLYLKKSKLCLDSVGLNTLAYKLVAFEERNLFTWLDVSINRTEVIGRVKDPSCTSAD